ncbi:MAG: hypothetical protein HIU93_12700 [Acidobacteria bacterium]|nr:hypothetical protein [Acidobacteriota bacterium]
MGWVGLASAWVLMAATGCHSAYVEATVTNHTAKTISLVEVDYPSASFGTQNLKPGQVFHYKFKVLGSGPVKVTYTDTAEKEHKASGPSLSEGNEGPLEIVIADGGVSWVPASFPASR